MADADSLSWWNLLNSEIAKAIAGSMIGAFAGAWGAHYIAMRTKVREELLQEVRDVNAAATVAVGIVETFIAMKRQMVKPLVNKFEKSKSDFLLHMEYADRSREVFAIEGDMQTITPAVVPVSQLQQLVFERITAPTRAMALTNTIARIAVLFNQMVVERNALCDEFRRTGVHPVPYYGLVTPQGADQRYLTTLTALLSYNDDLIYFSRMLAEDLVAYGTSVRAQLPNKVQETAKVIIAADFSKAADDFPDPARYKDWAAMFVPRGRPAGLHFWTQLSPDEGVV